MTKNGTRRQIYFNLFPLTRNKLIKRKRELFRARESNEQVMVKAIVRHRTTTLLRNEFFRYSKVKRRKLMAICNRPMNDNVGRPSFFFLPKTQAIKNNGRCPCFCTSSTTSTGNNGDLQRRNHLTLCLLRFRNVNRIISFGLCRSIMNFRMSFPLFTTNVFYNVTST